MVGREPSGGKEASASVPSARHIGIVGCSAPGAALCFQTICTEGAALLRARHAHPPVSLHVHSFHEYMRFIEAGDWRGVADLMLSSAEKLASIGAELLIAPDNTIHQALELFRGGSPRPWLHIAEEVAAEVKRLRCRRVALLGTKFLMEGPVYPPAFAARGIEYRIPEPDERERINAHIFGDMVEGRFTSEARAYFLKVVERLRRDGCDAVGMCCTEIPLLLRPEDTPLPLLDSTRLLARAALRWSTGGGSAA
ncbi:MAG: amino acid racemase [Deltaproteobacteria bacterium]|nr:amino acid racemase [Deltaproteobacteria bacterium]